MFKNRKITADDANTLNFGIPIVLTLFLFIVNGMIFATYFAESMMELFKMYLFFILIILLLDFLIAKRKKGTNTFIGINAYKNLVLSAIFVLGFLLINFIPTQTIFETKMACNKRYNFTLKKYAIPNNFSKFYIINSEEQKTYFKGGYFLQIKVAKSIFGYKVLEERTFEKL